MQHSRTPSIHAFLAQLVLGSAVLIGTSCGSSERQSGQRTALFSTENELGGHPVEQLTDGPWHIRRVEGGGTDDFLDGASSGPAGGVLRSKSVGPKSGALVDSLAVSFESVALEAGEPRPDDSAPSLRAGTTDDNAEFDSFLEYLSESREGLGEQVMTLPVGSRSLLAITDADGQPIPGARVTFLEEAGGTVVWRATTYGDGQLPVYRDMLEGGERPLLLEIESNGETHRHHWDGSSVAQVIRLGIKNKDVPTEIVLDVVFAIDTTGSMGDEILRIKRSLLTVTEKLRNLDAEFDLRYGAVLYRDIGDAYVTKAHPFTPDIAAFDKALQSVEAGGGGDGPESLNQALAVAIDGVEWREGAAKVVFLIADAPPHMDYENDVPYGQSLRAAVAEGIRIHAVAASGLGEAGSFVFRQIAQFCRGKFIFIEYGNDIAQSAAEHGVAGEVRSNNLDDILFAQIRDEIAHWGRTD